MSRVVDVRDEVSRRYGAGEDPTMLAAEFGLALSAMHHWLSPEGVHKPRRAGPDPAAVVAAYADGEPLRGITKRFAVDHKTVSKMVRRSDQPMRRPRLSRGAREEILAGAAPGRRRPGSPLIWA